MEHELARLMHSDSDDSLDAFIARFASPKRKSVPSSSLSPSRSPMGRRRESQDLVAGYFTQNFLSSLDTQASGNRSVHIVESIPQRKPRVRQLRLGRGSVKRADKQEYFTQPAATNLKGFESRERSRRLNHRPTRSSDGIQHSNASKDSELDDLGRYSSVSSYHYYYYTNTDKFSQNVSGQDPTLQSLAMGDLRVGGPSSVRVVQAAKLTTAEKVHAPHSTEHIQARGKINTVVDDSLPLVMDEPRGYRQRPLVKTPQPSLLSLN